MKAAGCHDIAELAISQSELMELLYIQHSANSDAGRSRIRNRFKSLLKARIFDEDQPGHGKKQKYTLLQVCEVYLYFSIADFGIDAWSAKNIKDAITEWAAYVAKVVIARTLNTRYKQEMFGVFRLGFVSSAVGDAPLISANQSNTGKYILDYPSFSTHSAVMSLGSGACILNLEAKGLVLSETYPRLNVEAYLASKKLPTPS